MVRQSLNFAILEIAEPPVKNPIVQTCMQHLSITSNITKRAIQLNGKKQWTGDQHGNMLAAFYYGYIIGMFPAALLSQHVGCYPIVSIVGLLNGLFHILFPMAIQYSYNMDNVFKSISISFISRFPLTKHSFPKCQNLQRKRYIRIPKWIACPIETPPPFSK